VAIRITKLEDSGLIARKLSAFSLIPCASPEFIEKHGPITHPSQLSGIPCIVDTNGRFLNNWRFDGPDGATVAVTVHGRLEVNSPLTAMRAAEAGLGVAVLPDFIFRERQPSGTLVPILEEYRSNDRGIYAIYPHRTLSSRQGSRFCRLSDPVVQGSTLTSFIAGSGMCRNFVHIQCDWN
jgi:DNA-binding transcriptional LysR family regulator